MIVTLEPVHESMFMSKFYKKAYQFFLCSSEILAELPQVWDNFPFPSQSSDVQGNWKKGNIALIFKKSKKEDPGNNQPVCRSSVPGKVMGQIS